ncbi:2-phospho-L-lactate guanylyltransferase [Streptomyces thermospinosisporus]|uniref:Phosphoenolpyruvate guanylyltransferase n=1 Tax=Streptomyces thermospinosisporus TaxID=161482 RepID=A0ABN1Z402_9ACTN
MQWTLLVPLKPLAQAKSRLADTADDGLRPGLALAFARDTVAAALACPAVRDVVVVTDDALAARELAAQGAAVVPDVPRGGLNAALAHAASAARARGAGALAALNADLPALRPRELARVLECAAAFPRAFLADAAGTGTTLLSAAPDRELHPLFGPDSRTRHRASGAVELLADPVDSMDSVDSVRQDVDTGEDLRAALALGVGPHTAAAAARLLMAEQ